MTKELKENKGLRIFTFVLVSTTAIGIPITLMFKTEYAILFTAWIKRTYTKVKKIYDSLTPEQKEQLRVYATTGIDLTKREVHEGLLKAGLRDKTAIQVVNTGHQIVRAVVKDTEKKLKTGKESK